MRHITTRTRRAVAAVAALSGVLAACGGDAEEPVAEPVAEAAADAAETADAPEVADAPAYGLVTPQQAADLANRDDVTVLDVRTPEEFADGHIDGAVLIDFYADDFADQVAALDPSAEYVVYCRSGNRSGQAVGLMRQLGFDQVYDMDGGVIAYAQEGLPLAR